MYRINITLSATILVLLSIVSVQTVFACECRRLRAVSDEFEVAETVIIAKILAEPDRDIQFPQQSIKVQVEKTYKGGVKVGETLTFGQTGGKVCLWYFRPAHVGKSYLFYLGKPTKARPSQTNEEIERSNAEARYYVSTCGRSSEIEKATDDISYLDKRLSTVSMLLPKFTALQLQPLVLCK